MSLDSTVIAALSAALENTPDDLPLRLHLGKLLLDGGDAPAALVHFAHVLAKEPANLDALRGAATAGDATGDPRAGGWRQLLTALGGAPTVTATSNQDRPVASFLPPPPPGKDGDRPKLRVVGTDAAYDDDDAERPQVTLADVGGMETVKKRLNVAFLGPIRNPEIRKAYGKSLRGGLLLYGPPGCGKTFIAKALAGELGARFFSVGLSDVMDMYIGESERKLHELFETARRNSPCVLFFDEIDALGHKRSQMRNNAGRNTVVSLLAELDGLDGNNEGVFVLAATNHPWDVDAALRRPGRLDRMVLVLPPDAPAREAILRMNLEGRPAGEVDTAWLAGKTNEFSGADLAHLCESAAEFALEESLETGQVRQLTTEDFKRALRDVRPSVRAWFDTAKNYAMFANEGGMYDELLGYIKTSGY